jgi:hypothetical protein
MICLHLESCAYGSRRARDCPRVDVQDAGELGGRQDFAFARLLQLAAEELSLSVSSPSGDRYISEEAG